MTSVVDAPFRPTQRHDGYGNQKNSNQMRAPMAATNMAGMAGRVSARGSVSSWDDFPVHQTSEFVRHPATSDRNFYDRYYFNLHPSGDDYFAIFGLGQYPNLGVTDAFCAVTVRGAHHVVRASRPLTDRADTSVGPIRVEVIEPLRKLRVVVEPDRPADSQLAMDVVWTAAIDAFEEPRQFLRVRGALVFDTQRFAQTGRWEGTLSIAGEEFEVAPQRCGGTRDRSWGLRPVGEHQPDGIRQTIPVMAGMWNCMPADYGDHSVIYMCHEEPDGSRPLQEGVRVWADPDRPNDWLGRPEWKHFPIKGTRLLAGSRIAFPDAPGGPVVMRAEPLLTNFVGVGTGYGLDADWRHGMWKGEEPVEQALSYRVEEIKAQGQYGVVDSVARFSYDDPNLGTRQGFGLYEHGFFGPFPQLGLHGRADLFA